VALKVFSTSPSLEAYRRSQPIPYVPPEHESEQLSVRRSGILSEKEKDRGIALRVGTQSSELKTVTEGMSAWETGQTLREQNSMTAVMAIRKVCTASLKIAKVLGPQTLYFRIEGNSIVDGIGRALRRREPRGHMYTSEKGRVQDEAYKELLGMRTYVSALSIEVLLHNQVQDLLGIIII